MTERRAPSTFGDWGGVADTTRSRDRHESWRHLPGPVRTALIEMAGRVVGTVDPAVVPAQLARIARFAPSKRARAGAAPLAKALADDSGFRALVAAALPEGFGRDTRDPVGRAVRSFLTGADDLGSALADVHALDELATLRNQVKDLTATVELLTSKLMQPDESSSAAPDGAGPQAGRHRSGAGAREGDHDESLARAIREADKLRARLREQGTRLRVVTDAAAADLAAATEARDAAVADAERERLAAAKWRVRAQEADKRIKASSARATRDRDVIERESSAADRRVELLLDAVSDAARGLRREWRLRSGGADPADMVAESLAQAPPVGERAPDSGLLAQWLALPQAHVIVDGYNVTKTGYAELTLAQQRDRLIRALEALAGSARLEVTVVFDGAAVVVPPVMTQRVRVVFSPPGVTADDVIRAMVAAEPVGRAVVVVSSDREIADGVRRSGARVAPSAVLLDLLTQ